MDLERKISDEIIRFLKLEQGGDTSGGSGHLSHVSHAIDDLSITEVKSNPTYSFRARVRYTKVIESEFTYYPDNPPHEYVYSRDFYLDRDLVISGYSKADYVSSNVDLDLFLPDVFDDEDQE